jgi:hypothetical protein
MASLRCVSWNELEGCGDKRKIFHTLNNGMVSPQYEFSCEPSNYMKMRKTLSILYMQNSFLQCESYNGLGDLSNEQKIYHNWSRHTVFFLCAHADALSGIFKTFFAN